MSCLSMRSISCVAGVPAAVLVVEVLVWELPPPLVSRTITTIATTAMPASSAAPPRLETGRPDDVTDAPAGPPVLSVARGRRVGGARSGAGGGADADPNPLGVPASASSAACARSRTALSGMPSMSATWA